MSTQGCSDMLLFVLLEEYSPKLSPWKLEKGTVKAKFGGYLFFSVCAGKRERGQGRLQAAWCTENKWGSRRTKQIWTGPYPLTNTYLFWKKYSSNTGLSVSKLPEMQRNIKTWAVTVTCRVLVSHRDRDSCGRVEEARELEGKPLEN